MSLGARLLELRLKKGESLQQVADAVGLSKTHVWELEKGRSKNPTTDLLTKLADHFGVTVRALIGEDPELEGTDEDLLRMFRQMGDLSERERALLDDMIQSMRRRRSNRNDSD